MEDHVSIAMTMTSNLQTERYAICYYSSFVPLQ